MLPGSGICSLNCYECLLARCQDLEFINYGETVRNVPRLTLFPRTVDQVQTAIRQVSRHLIYEKKVFCRLCLLHLRRKNVILRWYF